MQPGHAAAAWVQPEAVPGCLRHCSLQRPAASCRKLWLPGPAWSKDLCYLYAAGCMGRACCSSLTAPLLTGCSFTIRRLCSGMPLLYLTSVRHARGTCSRCGRRSVHLVASALRCCCKHLCCACLLPCLGALPKLQRTAARDSRKLHRSYVGVCGGSTVRICCSSDQSTSSPSPSSYLQARSHTHGWHRVAAYTCTKHIIR
jgi:hypothetical protein